MNLECSSVCNTHEGDVLELGAIMHDSNESASMHCVDNLLPSDRSGAQRTAEEPVGKDRGIERNWQQLESVVMTSTCDHYVKGNAAGMGVPRSS